MDLTANSQDYILRLQKVISILDHTEINAFLNALLKAREEHRNIFIMGNGGSASTASHFACDINKLDSGFRVISLNDNVPLMLAYSNDYGYEEVFIQQLMNILNKGDLVIGISGSGNSKNILKAIDYANKNDGTTIGITGYNGGELKNIAHTSVNARVDDMQISEDIHMILTHLAMQSLSLAIKGNVKC